MSNEFPAKLTLEPDTRAWDEAIRGVLTPDEVNRALVPAINRAADAAKTEAFKQATSQYTIKRKDVVDTLRVHKASAGQSNPGAELVFTGARIPILQFKVKPQAGFSFKGMPRAGRPRMFVQVRKDGGRSSRSLFVANMHGDKGKARAWRRTSEERFPVKAGKGPSMPQMVGNSQSVEAIQSKASDVLARRVDHELARIMSR